MSPRRESRGTPLFLRLLYVLALGACGEVHQIASDAASASPVGASCDNDQACESGSCVNGVCCGSACDGVCARCDLEGARGTCTPVDAGTACSQATCADGVAMPASQCDGHGACVPSDAESCGAYVCQDESACFESCTTDSACSGDNVCSHGVCAPPSCTDGVKTPPETAIDCGGGACPRCPAGQACQTGGDCESGTCATATSTCTAPTFAWRTSSFSTCNATACSLGTQTRSVWCERSDGTHVADALCASARPIENQSCTNTTGCSWFAGSYGACSAKCDGGTRTRPVYCRDGQGAQVPNAWCTGPAPTSSQPCNTFACVVYVVGEPSASMGPCWAPPNCLGGYPAYPACPAGYTATRSESACGNPNNCGSNWALCTFQNVVHYGCANPTYVMGITARECTFQ